METDRNHTRMQHVLLINACYRNIFTHIYIYTHSYSYYYIFVKYDDDDADDFGDFDVLGLADKCRNFS